MILSGFNIVHYLIDKGLLSQEEFVTNQLKIQSIQTRNRCFIIENSKRTNLFIKQVMAHEMDRTESLRNEVNVYWLAKNDVAFKNISSYIPELVEYDYHQHTLITEAHEDADNLLSYYQRSGTFPVDVAHAIAEIMACLHKDTWESMKDGKSRSLFKENMPFVFQINKSNLSAWGRDNEATKIFKSLLEESPDYLELIQQVKQEWKASSLLHGDIKYLNFLIQEGERRSIKLIDWELAFIGDPCWDIAAVIQGYLLFWIDRNNSSQSQTENDYKMGFELEDMQPSIHAFWDTYAEKMQLTNKEKQQNIVRIMKYCALKLIQTCTEASSQSSEYLPESAATMLQLSFNILKNPDHAAKELFNLLQTA